MGVKHIIPINFGLINDRALASLDSLLAQWLPDGKREGREYKALNPKRADSKLGSFSINLTTCAWADFATDDKGGDPISLYAYLHNLSQLDAARAVADLVGMTLDDAPAPASQEKPAAEAKKRSEWAPILPVPEDAPPPPAAHIKRGKPGHVWRYLDAQGHLLGLICRFTSSDGGKEILPLTFCRHAILDTMEWRWMAFPFPRPLYGLDRLRDGKPVLIVEGEKCADAAWGVPEVCEAFDVLTWPGGSKAVDKADWSPLAGRYVVIWPDCDAQKDKQGEILPEAKQPGMIAAQAIALGLAQSKCDVHILQIPEPGDKPSGWDIADAIFGGWDGERLLSYMRSNLCPPAQAKADESVPPPEDTDWQSNLIRKRGEVAACVANVFDILMHAPQWAGVLAFDEFSQRSMKLRPPPFDGGRIGEWEALDDTMTAMALSRAFDFTPSSATVAEAVEAYARMNPYHPVRDWLRKLRWDGVPRIDDWLTDFVGAPKTTYTIFVGRWYLIGMVARVMRPGVKFDYCLVLEGRQGKGKSTALGILGGEWFGDTDLDLSNKDSMSALRGKWLYEFPELGSLTRADASKQKSFLTRLIDDFRPVYGRREIRCPRQVVFGGSTNEWEWNKDPTGGRRFWPIEVGDMNLEGLRAAREQLFAEALVRFDAGERFFPTQQEQRDLFDPEQLKREQQESLIDALHDWVFSMTREFSITEAGHDGLKADASKMTRDFTTRIGIALRKLGCARVERRNGMIRFWYKPPVRNGAESTIEKPLLDDGGKNDHPF